MSIYYNATGETSEIDDALYAAWVAAGNPKAQAWTIRPDPPAYDPQTQQIAWDGAQWVVSAIPPPDSVPALAFELVLIQAGMIDAVLAYVGTQSAIVQAYWRRHTNWRRDSELIEAARVALGLTVEQVDALFAAAASVQA